MIERIRAYLLLALAVGAVYFLAIMLWPFLPAIVTSATLAVLVYPVFQWFRGRVRHNAVAALSMTVIVFFLVLLPALGVALLLLDQVRVGIAWIGADTGQLLAPNGTVAQWLTRIAFLVGLDPDHVSHAISSQSDTLVGLLAERTVGVFTGLGGGLLQAGVALFTLYYLLRDGETLVRHIKWLLPLEPSLSDRLFEQAREVTSATIFGNVVVAIVQGVIGGLAFWALGLPAPIVWGTLMGVLSILPVVGAFVVWVPAALILLGTGAVVRGVALLAIGALVISTIDNVLRALLVGERAQLHPLIVFFSVLGGLVAFGAVGVFVGPVLFVVSLTLIEMARVSLDHEPLPARPAAPDAVAPNHPR